MLLISFTFLMSLGQVLFKKTALSLSSNAESLGLLEGILRALSVPDYIWHCASMVVQQFFGYISLKNSYL